MSYHYFEILKENLEEQILKHNLQHKEISIKCKILTPEEAIGNPDKDDFPIIKGKEKMIEASFEGVKGQAFTDEYGNLELTVDELLKISLSSNKNRSIFIASINAIYNYLGLIENVIHCKNDGPRLCSQNLSKIFSPDDKVFLVGFQPRFLEFLSSYCNVKTIDLDDDNIGKIKFGIEIFSPDKKEEFIEWCDKIFVTGSTSVNGSMDFFIKQKKPTWFYGITGVAATKILDLQSFCYTDKL